MSEIAEQQDVPSVTAEGVRATLRYYPARKRNIFLYLTEAYAVTLEVFLHQQFGERYLTWPKCLLGFVFLYVVGTCSPPWGVSNVHLFDLPFLPSLHIPIPNITDKRLGTIDLLESMLWFYALTAQWRQLEIFLHNRFSPSSDRIRNKAVRSLFERFLTSTHPRSSGEPFDDFDESYIFFYRCNFRIDVVKQGLEPICCFVLGFLVSGFSVTYDPDHDRRFLALLFIGVWLITASIALFVKATFENHRRKSLYLDQLANEKDMEALRTQRRLNQPAGSGAVFSEVT